MSENTRAKGQCRHSCCCNWGNECLALHNKCFDTDDPRGKAPIRQDLSGVTESNTLWRKMVLTNLGTEEKELKNIKEANICRHHWSVQQLHHFCGTTKKLFPSTPMRYSDIYKIVYVVENRYVIKRKGIDYFYNAPNFPMAVNEIEATSLRNEPLNDESKANNKKMHVDAIIIKRSARNLIRKLTLGLTRVIFLTYNEHWER